MSQFCPQCGLLLIKISGKPNTFECTECKKNFSLEQRFKELKPNQKPPKPAGSETIEQELDRVRKIRKVDHITEIRCTSGHFCGYRFAQTAYLGADHTMISDYVVRVQCPGCHEVIDAGNVPLTRFVE